MNDLRKNILTTLGPVSDPAYQEMQRKAEAFDMLEDLWPDPNFELSSCLCEYPTRRHWVVWTTERRFCAATHEAAIRAAHAAMRGEE